MQSRLARSLLRGEHALGRDLRARVAESVDARLVAQLGSGGDPREVARRLADHPDGAALAATRAALAERAIVALEHVLRGRGST